MQAITELISTFIPSAAIDVVGVYKDFEQVFERARPIKATIKEDSKIMEQPIETGATLTDHKIILPVEIELALLLQSKDYKDAYQQIKQLFKDSTRLEVQTKTDVYTNQIIVSFPHEEDPEQYDLIKVALKLKEAIFVTPKFVSVPKSAKNKATVDRGNQQTKETTKKTSVLHRTLF